MTSARLLLGLAWLAGFTLIDASIVSLALSDIARDFDRSVAELAWVSTGFLLALASTLLAAGRLSDRVGSRLVLTGGAIAFLVTTAASGLAPTFEWLIAARIAQGVAGGVLYAVSLAIAVTAFPPERRAGALALYFTSGALGAVIGPVIGGVLTDLGGWRLVYLAQLPLPVAVGIGAWLLLPASGGRLRSFDVPGVVAASVFIVAATFGLLQLAVPEGGVTAAAAGGIALAALVAFVVVESRATQPAVRLAIFTNPRFVVASVAGAGAWFAIMSSTIYPALYLQLGRGFSGTDAGILLLAAPLVGLVSFPFMGRIVGILGPNRAMLVGLSLLVSSGAVMLTWSDSAHPWLIFATNLVTGAGIALTLVASATDALAQFPPSEAGTGSAVFNSLRQLGAAMGVAAPAVAFELIAMGSRSSEAALAGSRGAFVVRLAVLAIPLILVVARVRSHRAPAHATA
ncbi:MAG: MFS transporter [Chloroflexi bacterium]|nr:MFS transporter [Chloroflexota bacterium]